MFCPMTDFLIVNSKVTSDYDLAEDQILEWVHLSEVLTGKDSVVSFWPPLARIPQLPVTVLVESFSKLRVLLLISWRF